MWIKQCCKFSLPLGNEKVDHHSKGKHGGSMRWIRSKALCMASMDIERDDDFQSSPEEFAYPKITVKEVFAATENMDHKNFIGEGTAGKHGGSMRWIRSKALCMASMDIERDDDFQSSPEEFAYPKITVKEVFAATENMDHKNFIGEGTAGKVYQGILSNKQQIAVKHIINDGYDETFLREIQSISHVRHPNLVTLLGYCEKGDQFFLIYELCPYGNLSQWLFGKDKNLSWIQRLHIAVDSARGLWFLHTYPEGCIVHRDIKPTNILIGKNFDAKLSDFGLSKVIDIGKSYATSEVRGTFGYVDPEYQTNNQVNPSSDVYSFGVVLLQIISGRRVINIDRKNPMPLNKMARSLSRHGNSISGFADPKLNSEYSPEAFDLVFKLALLCTSNKQLRPSMEQVVLTLEEAFQVSTRATSSTPGSSSD